MGGPGRRDGRGARAVLSFLGVSAALGLVVAAMALPFIGSGAIAARDAARSFENLPSSLDAPPPAARSVLLARDGSVIGAIAYENRVQVPLDAVSRPMRAAIVAVEDSRFYEHGGVDLRGTLRALARNSSAGAVQEGGSTLTQQYVKNVLVDDASTKDEREAARERTLTRKLQEARYAIGLEKRLSKDEILERYLNIAYFGSGAYGVEAAATHYFDVKADELTLSQAATLAGIVQSPVSYDPVNNPKAAEARRNIVLDRMRAEGLAAPADIAKAKARSLADDLDVQPFTAGCVTSSAPYFCDYVLSVIRTSPQFGEDRAARESLLRRGGLTIQTTLDPRVQKAAQRTVDRAIPRNDPSRKATAVVTVEPGTGHIRVMAQNRAYGSKKGQTTQNYSVGAAHNGWTDGVQAGSTFKAFTIAAALEKGLPTTTKLSTRSRQTFRGFEDCDGNKFGPYSPASDANGPQTMASATALSVNGYFVELERRIGLCDTARMVDRLGVRLATGKAVPRVPSLTLGTAATTPLEMAEGFATFAANGVHCHPIAITAVRDREGRDLTVPSAACKQVISSGVAKATTQLLTGVIDGPIRSRTGAAMSLGRPAAGKTGTTDDNAAVWFVGYTPQLTTAVWVGDPRGAAKHPLRNVRINGRYYAELYGGTFAGPIWKAVMRAALKDEPRVDFSDPRPGEGVNGLPVRVPDLANVDSGDALQRLEELGLKGRVDPVARASALPEGTVLWTNPRAGTKVRSGDTVRMVVSSGVPPPPPAPPSVPPAPSAVAVPAAPSAASPRR